MNRTFKCESCGKTIEIDDQWDVFGIPDVKNPIHQNAILNRDMNPGNYYKLGVYGILDIK